MRLACYLVQTRNDYLATVGTDVLVQVKPLPLLGARLENKACDGRVLSFRKGPLQKNTCWALISRKRRGGLQLTSPQWRTWCRGIEKGPQLIRQKRSGGKIKLQWRKLLLPQMFNLESVRGAGLGLMLVLLWQTKHKANMVAFLVYFRSNISENFINIDNTVYSDIFGHNNHSMNIDTDISLLPHWNNRCSSLTLARLIIHKLFALNTWVPNSQLLSW